jgi:acyl carrier protein
MNMRKKTKVDINMSRTRETLKAVVLDRAEVELTDEYINSGKPFSELGIDSLDTIEILVSVEDELDLELDNDRLDACENVKQLVEYLSEFD